MEVRRSGWAFWIGLIYALFSALYLGIEAYVRYSGLSLPPEIAEALRQSGAEITEEMRLGGIAGSVIGLFFGITLMGQRKSVYFWTVISILFTIASSAYVIHNYPTEGVYINLAIGAVIQVLLFILVVRLMATGRLR
jgi:hypothetical protein